MYINNLVNDITSLQESLNDTLDTLSPCQREIVRGVLEVFKYSLGKIGETNYGCCQDICLATACWDVPDGFTDPGDSTFLVALSNIGIEQQVSPATIQEWWESSEDECEFTKTVLSELGAGSVSELLNSGSLGLDIDTPSEVIILLAIVALAYIVFGDPILLLHNTDSSLSDDSINDIISSFLGSDWGQLLEDAQGDVPPELELSQENVTQLIRWLFTEFQNTMNQVTVLWRR